MLADSSHLPRRDHVSQPIRPIHQQMVPEGCPLQLRGKLFQVEDNPPLRQMLPHEALQVLRHLGEHLRREVLVKVPDHMQRSRRGFPDLVKGKPHHPLVRRPGNRALIHRQGIRGIALGAALGHLRSNPPFILSLIRDGDPLLL